MVEGERAGQLFRLKHSRVLGVVTGDRLARGPAHVDQRDRMLARIAARVRVHTEQSQELDLEAGFFARFANGGVLDRLPVIDQTAGDGPAVRLVASLDEHETAAFELYDHIGGHGRRPWPEVIDFVVGFIRHLRSVVSRSSTRLDRVVLVWSGRVVKCVILSEPGELRVEQVPDPVAGSGDVIVRVRAALTCGTDLKAYRRGHPAMPCPTPFGHEFAGEIVELGADVGGFRVGDAVMAANTGPCGGCFFCDRDQQNLCTTLMDEMILGAYAELVRVPARVVRANLFSKPDALPFEHAALLEPLSSVCFGLDLLTPEIRRSDATALILGAGPIALLWLVALRDAGVGSVVVGGRRRARLEAAARLGADAVCGEGEDLRAQVAERTQGRGADVVIECTGLPEVWEVAPEYARRGGLVVLFGGCPGGTRVSLDTYRLHYDGVRIASPFHFRPRDVQAARTLLLSGGVDWERFITSHAGLDDVPALFERLADGRDIKCAVLPHGR